MGTKVKWDGPSLTRSPAGRMTGDTKVKYKTAGEERWFDSPSPRSGMDPDRQDHLGH